MPLIKSSIQKTDTNEITLSNNTLNNIGSVSIQTENQNLDNNNYVQKNANQTSQEYNSNQVMNQFYKIIEIAVKLNASDIHISPNYPPIVRLNGKLEKLNLPILSAEYTEQLKQILLKEKNYLQNKKIFNEQSSYDIAYKVNNTRLRINIYKISTGNSFSCRIINNEIKTLDDLHIPKIVEKFINFPNGLVLVTGPTGSGKSTTIASLLNCINKTQKKHIITLEDPIEYIFQQVNCLIEQREFNSDFTSWDDALKSVLRQDPDIIFVGEMRDYQTIESTLRLAETGHLVFATLHTNSASETIDRIIDIFPENKHEQIRIQLASVLRTIISQRLINTNTGSRMPAVEILINNSAVRNYILEKLNSQIDNIIQTSLDTGMISMERSLVNLVKKGLISITEAKLNSLKPNDIDILLKN